MKHHPILDGILIRTDDDEELELALLARLLLQRSQRSNG
jgi:hypothetical protein